MVIHSLSTSRLHLVFEDKGLNSLLTMHGRLVNNLLTCRSPLMYDVIMWQCINIATEIGAVTTCETTVAACHVLQEQNQVHYMHLREYNLLKYTATEILFSTTTSQPESSFPLIIHTIYGKPIQISTPHRNDPHLSCWLGTVLIWIGFHYIRTYAYINTVTMTTCDTLLCHFIKRVYGWV